MSLRIGAIVLDCQDPRALAEFYRELLGWKYHAGHEQPGEDRWLVLDDPGGGTPLAFQRATQALEPVWPDPTGPALLHLDVEVDDLGEQHERVVALGARPLTDHPGPGSDPFRVYADPAGHPFCLCAC